MIIYTHIYKLNVNGSCRETQAWKLFEVRTEICVVKEKRALTKYIYILPIMSTTKIIRELMKRVSNGCQDE